MTPWKNYFILAFQGYLSTLLSLREKFLYSELFCPVFSGIRTEYGKIRSISPYSVQMRENTPYLSVFSSNAGKYGPENTPICTLFKQWRDRFQISAASLTLISEWAPPSNKYLPSNKCHISKRRRYQKSDNNLTVTSWKWKWNKCTNYEKK